MSQQTVMDKRSGQERPRFGGTNKGLEQMDALVREMQSVRPTFKAMVKQNQEEKQTKKKEATCVYFENAYVGYLPTTQTVVQDGIELDIRDVYPWINDYIGEGWVVVFQQFGYDHPESLDLEGFNAFVKRFRDANIPGTVECSCNVG